jgi:hypothetical protein
LFITIIVTKTTGRKKCWLKKNELLQSYGNSSALGVTSQPPTNNATAPLGTTAYTMGTT